MSNEVLDLRVSVDYPHSRTWVVVCSHICWGKWMHLAQVGGPAGQATDDVTPCFQFILHVRCKLDLPPRGLCEIMLHSCEHPLWSSYVWGDSSQHPQEIAPFSEVVWDVLVIASRADWTLAFRLGGRRSKWGTVSRFHPSTVFWVNRAPPPCSSFLREIGSFLSVSIASLGRNNLPIWLKRFRSICRLSLGLPRLWKLSRPCRYPCLQWRPSADQPGVVPSWC